MVSRSRLKWALPVLVVVSGAALWAVWPYWTADPPAEVDRLLALLELKPGMAVAEVGAGDGRRTVLRAERLGPSSQVHSTELGSKELSRIRDAVAKGGLRNVTVVPGGEKETNLPKQCCDAIFMRRVYHHFTDPRALNASMLDALRPGGRLAVIDFAPRPWMFWLWRPEGVRADRGGHGMPPALLIQELTQAGFMVERRIADWPGRDYCVVARKPK